MKRKLNWIDIVIIIVVVALGALGVYKFTNVGDVLTKNYVEANVVFKVTQAPMGLVEQVEDGDTLYDSLLDFEFGTVTDMTYEPHKELVTNSYGNVEYKEIPNQYDMYVTVKCRLEDSDAGLGISTRKVVVGTEIRLISRTYIYTGAVYSIELLQDGASS